jgi:hypothetical protein
VQILLADSVYINVPLLFRTDLKRRRADQQEQGEEARLHLPLHCLAVYILPRVEARPNRIRGQGGQMMTEAINVTLETARAGLTGQFQLARSC